MELSRSCHPSKQDVYFRDLCQAEKKEFRKTLDKVYLVKHEALNEMLYAVESVGWHNCRKLSEPWGPCMN